MDITPVKTPRFISSIFPDFTWRIPSKEKVLYLTFDDGPTPEITDWTLDILKTYNAKATFFCIGKNIEENPLLYQRILSEGHGVGNHTFNHLKGWKTNTKDYLENIDKAQELITRNKFQTSDFKDHHLEKVKFFRPPYGRINPKQAKKIIQMGYKVIMWSVLAKDWDRDLSGGACLENVTKNASSGDIVVFHDSVKASNNLKYVLPEVLAHFSHKGYIFKRIPE